MKKTDPAHTKGIASAMKKINSLQKQINVYAKTNAGLLEQIKGGDKHLSECHKLTEGKGAEISELRGILKSRTEYLVEIEEKNTALQKQFASEMADQVTRLKAIQMNLLPLSAVDNNDKPTPIIEFIWNVIQKQIAAVEKIIEGK